MPLVPVAHDNGEFCLTAKRRHVVLREAGQPGQGRKIFPEKPGECLHVFSTALYLDAHAFAGVPYAACEAQLLCQAVDKRPEANALYLS